MLNVYKQTCINRYFELEVAKAVKNNRITCPVYLGIGQEHIAACWAEKCRGWAVFPQHRCHSYGLSFGISPEKLKNELLGLPGLNNGMGGSASFGESSLKIFGHSGLLGDQVPIACGYSLHGGNTLCVLGDAAAEEDYALASLGFAATHNLPILFICEDNNLSILTEKKIRRNWSIINVAKGFGLNTLECDDKPETILNIQLSLPMLININTKRHWWHAGVGQDGPPEYDRLSEMRSLYGSDIELNIKAKMEKLWQH